MNTTIRERRRRIPPFPERPSEESKKQIFGSEPVEITARPTAEQKSARFPLLAPTKRPVGNDGIARGLARLRWTSKQKTKEQNFMKISFSKLNQSGRQRRFGFAFLLATFLGSCVTTELRAQVVVVPNAQATNDGNTLATTPSGPVRFMQIHDASQFGALAGPSLLTQFAWRPDQTLGQSGPKSVTLQIYASTTSRSVAGLSTTFADNLGTNNTLVFDGTLTWATANLPGPGNTRQFDIVFPLTTPFLYDPAAGNLLLDFQLSDNGGSSITFDRVSGNEFTRQAAAPGSANATTAQFFVDSQVTQFTFVPEPATGALLGLGAAGFLCRRFGRGNRIDHA